MTSDPSPPRQALVLFGAVATCLAVGAIGGLATSHSVASWYPALAKPAFNPPRWIFAPVWTVLYLIMAVAAWLVWRRNGWRAARPALTLFALQLALNLAWSLLFFGLRRIDLALIDVLALLAAIAATALAFWPLQRLAALLLVPYFAWVGFAAFLNFAIWQLN